MSLRAIDLFCGAGGLSQGFRQAGFDVRLGVDADDDACATYRTNQPGAKALVADLCQLSAADLLNEAGLSEVEVVLGGPSCQGFSTHGRRNGWVRPDDSRNFLYREYARIVEELQPLCFVMENVPGLLYYDNGRFWERIRRRFARAGYRVRHELLLAADYGIPQLRRRLLIVGTRMPDPFDFPRRTHVGALRRDHREMWEKRRLAEWPKLAPHVGVWDAISDLPLLEAGAGSAVARYGGRAHTEYQRRLRAGSSWLYDHQASPLSEGHLRQVEHVPEGGTWRDIPLELLPETVRTHPAHRQHHAVRPARARLPGLHDHDPVQQRDHRLLHPSAATAGAVGTRRRPHPDVPRPLPVRRPIRVEMPPDWQRRTAAFGRSGRSRRRRPRRGRRIRNPARGLSALFTRERANRSRRRPRPRRAAAARE